MIKYLIDTNVLSEAVKTVPDTSVLKMFEKFQHEIVTAVPVWHEIQFGCQRLPRSRKREVLDSFLPDGLTVEQLIRGDYFPSIRNKQIATVFKEAGIIEKYGSGFKRVLEAFSEYDLPQPIFEEIQNGFKVTIFKATQKTTQKTRTHDQILALLSKNPNMTREDLARALSKSPNTGIKLHIAKLKAAGRLKRIGSDRNGYWEVILTD